MKKQEQNKKSAIKFWFCIFAIISGFFLGTGIAYTFLGVYHMGLPYMFLGLFFAQFAFFSRLEYILMEK
jgi:hypothetical protein